MEHRKHVVEYLDAHAIRGVVFDFDGTLIDLKVDWNGLREALRKEFALTNVQRINELLHRIREVHGEEGIQKAYQIVETFEAAHTSTTPLLKERKELIIEIAKRDIIMGIVSNNMTRTISDVLEQHSLTNYIKTIIGKDAVEEYKPHTEGIDTLLQLWNFSPERVLLVGNDKSDETLAANAHVHFINLRNE